MSTLDDARTLVQDMVVPDLKALSARVDALEKTVKSGFDAVEKLSDVRHELMMIRMDTGLAAVNAKIDGGLAAVSSKMDTGFAAINARFDALVTTLNMERRMDQMEAIISAQSKGRMEEQKSS